MSQIAQLSEAEIEDRFHIVGARQVAFLLADYVRATTSFSVQFQGGNGLFLTTLLAVNAQKGELVFDCSGSVDANRAFLQSDHSTFIGRPDGIHVQFSIGRAQETLLGGAKAFVARLPERIVRLQRREAFRIETPRLRPLQFFSRLPGGALLNLPVHDISVSGIGLNAQELPDSLVLGMTLDNCHFALPDDAQELFFSATLRRIAEIESRTGARQWRIGLEFNKLRPADESRIQRYIVRIERERHELSG